MRRLTPLVLTSLALVAAACGGSTSGKVADLTDNDVAVVGSQQITKDDFQALMRRAQKSYQAQKRPFPKPGTAAYETLKGQAINFLVQRAEFAQKADDLGVDVSDQKVDDRIDQLKKQYYGGSEARYKQTLKQQGLTEEQAREEVRAQLISEGLFKKITDDVKVNDDELKTYYNQHKSQYGQAASRDVRHILVTKKALADKLYGDLKNGANFATLARKYSKDPGSAKQGGKLTVSKGQTVPPFDKVAFSLKKGEISQPVKTQYGYHIIQALSDIKPAQTESFDKVKDSIRQQLEQQKKNDTMTKWVDDTKKYFCGDTRIKYQLTYKPVPDPCSTITGTTTTTG